MNLELHAKGASFIAHQTEDNPRDIIVEMLSKQPNEDRKVLFTAFCDEIGIDTGNGYQRAVAWYFFVNMYDYLATNRSRPSDPVQRAEARVQQRERIEAIKAQIVLLDLTMTNGKSLRDCTFQEVATFSNRFAKLATKGKKTELVGAVLDEAAVQAIMK